MSTYWKNNHFFPYLLTVSFLWTRLLRNPRSHALHHGWIHSCSCSRIKLILLRFNFKHKSSFSTSKVVLIFVYQISQWKSAYESECKFWSILVCRLFVEILMKKAHFSELIHCINGMKMPMKMLRKFTLIYPSVPQIKPSWKTSTPMWRYLIY